MKGSAKVIARLNARLAEELTAISQYMLHAEMCDNWGYKKLHDAIEKRAKDEMRHAEMLIGRILFLEGKPIVSKLVAMKIGATVEAQLKNDWDAEDGAVKAYNADVVFCLEAEDNGTREILDAILKDEEAHIDWIETQTDQIAQMGAQTYLGRQIE